MSRFDDNPFSDPAIDNPFADPSVQQVTRGVPNAQRGLDDYNPFDNQGRTQPNAPSQQESQPAIMQAVSPPPTAPSTNKPPPNFTTEDFQRRQEELERKAAELARREAELMASGGATGRINNWPPIPGFCPFKPCFYHDINVDIQLEFQNIVRKLYYLWMFNALVLSLNIIGGMAILIGTGTVSTFGLSFVYFALMVPFSFFCWYRPVYKAFQSDSSLYFIVFFFMFIFQTIVTICQALGFADTCGLITSIRLFESNIAVGVFTMLIACGFCVAAVGDILLIIKVHRIYRSKNLDMKQASDEFTTNFMRDRHVQNAASNIASAAISSQFSNNRY